MSARPRPVTATFKPASMMPPTGVRERQYSWSSDGSTASLISVLDHESCEEDEEQSFENVHTKQPETQTQMKGKPLADARQSQPPQSHEPLRPISNNTNHQNIQRKKLNRKVADGGRRTPLAAGDECQVDGDGELTPWGRWVVEKAKLDREKQEEKLRHTRDEKEKHKQKEQEEEEKKKKADEKYKEWAEKKTQDLKLKQKGNRRETKVKDEIEEEKKRTIDEKSMEKYKEWLEQKRNQKKQLKKQEKEKKQQEEERKREKEEKGLKAYNEWCAQAKRRPHSSCSSYAYNDGKLTGYHDATALPAPSFYNPMPWMPIHVPQPKSERSKKQRPKYRWNPNKYL